MDGIHILRGRGNNCTCYDCSVLYGGTCYTTPYNNFLDKIEKSVLKAVDNRYISYGRMNKAIEAIRPHAIKYFKISSKEFDSYFYNWLPLLFIMTSTLHKKDIHPNASAYDVRRKYMEARLFILWGIEKEYKQKNK